MSNQLNELRKLPGFKLAGSHFRIGSKLHLSDFYYAKLCFQNSFYSSRFAFLLTQSILTDISKENDWEDIKNKGLTLVGYGLHSEYMLSLMQRFLLSSGAFTPTSLNYEVIIDSEAPIEKKSARSGSELQVVRNEALHHYALLIIPIACTLSTSIKVQQFLEELSVKRNKKIAVLSPHYNLLHVSDTNSEKQPTPLEDEFGWKEKDFVQRRIILKSFYDKGERKAKYIIRLASKWNDIKDCPLCFPKAESPDFPLGELPLLETDRASLVPRLVFEFPRGKEERSDRPKSNFILESGMINYGPGNPKKHFLFGIDRPQFLRANREKFVEPWLKKLKETKVFREEFSEYSHVVILSPAQAQNSIFLLLTNEILFSSSANIIHFDPTNDYIENFQKLYGEELRNADRIIFVNDSLFSGDLFFQLDDLVRSCRRNNIQDTKKNDRVAIDMAVILIDQSPTHIYEAVEERLNTKIGLFSFVQLNLFSSVTLRDMAMGVKQRRYYEELIGDSLLDGSKLHFIRQKNKFISGKARDLFEQRAVKHWWLAKATHNLYSLFRNFNASDFKDISFNDFLKIYKSNENFDSEWQPRSTESEDPITDEEIAILKVLTHSPFTQFSPVLQLTFRWTVQLLVDHITTIRSKLTSNPSKLSYSDFRWLKFLLRRASLINSNYIISVEFYQFLHLFYEKGVPILLQDLEHSKNTIHSFVRNQDEIKKALIKNSQQISDIKHFNIYYTAQVKILLSENEQRSIVLERNINQLTISNLWCSQQIRMLREENSVVLKRFYEFLRFKPTWNAKMLEGPEEPDFTDTCNGLVRLLSQDEIIQHQLYRSLQLFFEESERKAQNSPLDKNFPLLIFLSLLHFLEFEREIGGELLTKTKIIFKKIKDLLEISQTNEPVIQKTGVFLIARNYDQELTLVSELYEDIPLFEQYFWEGQQPFVKQFLNGDLDKDLDHKKTITELYRPPNSEDWYDLYALQPNSKIPGLTKKFLPDNLNHVILIRLNFRDSDKDTSLGLLGIYFERETDAITDLNRIRYLLLARQGLSNFVQQHHQSSEFLELQDTAIARRMELLAGHGRDMITNLATKYKHNNGIFEAIASHLSELQHIMSYLQYSKSNKGLDNMSKRFYEAYHVGRSGKEIDHQFIDQIFQLAKDIFSFKDVEIEISLGKDSVFSNKIQPFLFDKNILAIICFELFVNAKKNRWHFLPNAPAIPGFDKNLLRVEFSQTKDGHLNILIANTGPKPSDHAMDELQTSSLDRKLPNLTSGTKLIKYIVTGILKDKINFRVDPFGDTESGVYWFIAEITLRPMLNDEDEKDFAGRKSMDTVL